MAIFNIRDNENNRWKKNAKEKKRKKQKNKGTRGTKGIAKGWKVNDFVKSGFLD